MINHRINFHHSRVTVRGVHRCGDCLPMALAFGVRVRGWAASGPVGAVLVGILCRPLSAGIPRLISEPTGPIDRGD